MAGVAAAPRRALVLIGFMGAGKSTVAAELARALGTEALDSDELLQRRFGHSPAKEFELHGEASFRAAEEQLVC
jgi:shikimate kinase